MQRTLLLTVTCTSLFCHDRWCPCITHCRKRRKATAIALTCQSRSSKVLDFIFFPSLRTFYCIWRFPHSLLYLFFSLRSCRLRHLVFASTEKLDEVESVYKLTIKVLWVYQRGGFYADKVSKCLSPPVTRCSCSQTTTVSSQEQQTETHKHPQIHHKDREHKHAKTVAPSTRCDNCGAKSSGRHDELLTCVVVPPPLPSFAPPLIAQLQE